jgi:Flp pilus assembly protein TadG
MRSPTRSFAANRRAVAAVEFALIVPLMIVMVAGLVEFGRFYQVYTVANRLGTQYAVAWANCSESSTDTNGVCANEIADYTKAAAISNVAPQLTPSALTLTMAEFTVTQAGVASMIYVGGNTAGASNTTGDATQLSNAKLKAATAFNVFAGPAAVQYVVVTEVKYVHTLDFFPTLMSAILGDYLTISNTSTLLKS